MRILFILSVLLSVLLYSCEDSFGSEDIGGRSVSPTGQGGSLARFAIQNNNLYVLTDRDLKQLSIDDPLDPQLVSTQTVEEGMETIFPYADTLLFLGSQTSMFIYSTTSDRPQFLSVHSHFTACDPVVVDYPYAYVTLRSTGCRPWGEDLLEVIDVTDPLNPQLVNTYFDLISPHGLGVDGNLLFVCQDDNGLRVYDRTDPVNLTLMRTLNITAWDVIPYQGNLIVTGADGIHQYSYSQEDLSVTHLSTLHAADNN